MRCVEPGEVDLRVRDVDVDGPGVLVDRGVARDRYDAVVRLASRLWRHGDRQAKRHPRLVGPGLDLRLVHHDRVAVLRELTRPDEVRGDLQARLLKQKAKEKLASARSELGELAYEQQLPALAKRYAVPLIQSGVIPRNGVTTGIGANAAVRTAAFSDDLRDGANSSVLDVDGGLVVLRQVRHQPARAMTFAEAHERARVVLMNELRLQFARRRAAMLVSDVRRTGSLTPSIQALAVTWQSRALAQRAAADVPPAVLKAAFELPRAFGGAKASGRVVELDNGHLAAVVLTRVVDGLSNSASQAGLREFLAKQSGERQFGAFLTRLEAKASIKRNSDATAAADLPPARADAPPATTSG